MAGRVHQINVSQGGVPNLPVPEARITTVGVEDDDQADKVHHGGPLQTVGLYSREVIEAPRDEGNTIFPGAAGNNLAFEGIDWEAWPGTRLRVGPVLLEVSVPTTPCHKNARWFVDGHFGHIHRERHPGWSRMYALVLEEGLVRTGDDVEIVEGEQ